jgi:transposase-like protein
MESSHIPLTKWALGFRLYAASKKGFSAHELHRVLGITYKSAWFMAHRIREAMAPAADAAPLGGEGVVVESDETELGSSHKTRKRKPRSMNKKFVTLVERGGKVRSRNITGVRVSLTQEVRDTLKMNLDPASTLHTDSAAWYDNRTPAAKHERVNHSIKEYARTAEDGSRVHVNSAEGYFSIFKRGLVGTYQIMSEQHLHRYLHEFDFRMNNRVALGVNDDVRTERAIKGAEGKRLRYQGTNAV